METDLFVVRWPDGRWVNVAGQELQKREDIEAATKLPEERAQELARAVTGGVFYPTGEPRYKTDPDNPERFIPIDKNELENSAKPVVRRRKVAS